MSIKTGVALSPRKAVQLDGMNLERVEPRWAHDLIEQQAGVAAKALRKFCRKPKSAARLHKARKGLARLRAALQDLGETASVGSAFCKRVQQLHSRAGKVRDMDVLLERLDGYAKRAGEMECDEIRIVQRDLRKRRKKARRALQSLLDGLPKLHA